MRIGKAAGLWCALAVTACQPEFRPEPPPKIVEVAVDKLVSLCPEGGDKCALLANCYDETAKEQTNGEAKRLANLRRASIEECNVRMERIRSLQPRATK